jgi:hypothetical protein
MKNIFKILENTIWLEGNTKGDKVFTSQQIEIIKDAVRADRHNSQGCRAQVSSGNHGRVSTKWNVAPNGGHRSWKPGQLERAEAVRFDHVPPMLNFIIAVYVCLVIVYGIVFAIHIEKNL